MFIYPASESSDMKPVFVLTLKKMLGWHHTQRELASTNTFNHGADDDLFQCGWVFMCSSLKARFIQYLLKGLNTKSAVSHNNDSVYLPYSLQTTPGIQTINCVRTGSVEVLEFAYTGCGTRQGSTVLIWLHCLILTAYSICILLTLRFLS